VAITVLGGEPATRAMAAVAVARARRTMPGAVNPTMQCRVYLMLGRRGARKTHSIEPDFPYRT